MSQLESTNGMSEHELALFLNPPTKLLPGRIVFEGIDGTGKDSLIAALQSFLEEEYGKIIEVVREPTKKITETDKIERSAAFGRDRWSLYKMEIELLARGKIIIKNRSVLSSYAYQCGGEGIPAVMTRLVNPPVDFSYVFVLYLPIQLLNQRLNRQSKDLYHTQPDAFFDRVQKEYEKMANAMGYFILDATLPIEVNCKVVMAKLKEECHFLYKGSALKETDREYNFKIDKDYLFCCPQ